MQIKYYENETKFQLSERKRNDSIKLLQDELQNEKKVGIALRNRLEECVLELQEVKTLEQQLAQSMAGNEKSVNHLETITFFFF